MSRNAVGNEIEKKKDHHVTKGGIIEYKETDRSLYLFNLEHDMSNIKILIPLVDLM